MRNPLCTCRDWWNREGERASAKGGLQLFWFSLTSGLVWAIFMVICLGLFDHFSSGKSVLASMQSHFLIYFVLGMVVGLSTWKKQAKPGKGCRPRD